MCKQGRHYFYDEGISIGMGKYNINVNAVSPTVVFTEIGRKAWVGQVGENTKHKIPMGCFAVPEEVSAAILFLASDASDMHIWREYID